MPQRAAMATKIYKNQKNGRENATNNTNAKQNAK
jgi:hypothetical protein